MTSQLLTDRLHLRPWLESDAPVLARLVAERGSGTPTAADRLARIRVELAESESTGIGLFAACPREGGDLVGYCGLIVGRASVAEPEIAYEFFRRVHGRGLATEAATAVLAAAAATGRRRLWSTVRGWNGPSLRVLEKLGFARHHTTTDERGDIVWLTRTLDGVGPDPSAG
jgi:RimJ/RimL family protein N-acetyltransferase